MTKSRIVENASIFDFSIDQEDMEKLDGFNENMRVCWDPTNVLWVSESKSRWVDELLDDLSNFYICVLIEWFFENVYILDFEDVYNSF